MRLRQVVTLILMIVLGAVVGNSARAGEPATSASDDQTSKDSLRDKPDSYWKSKLDPEVYQVTRRSGTEVPFTGKYWNNHKSGIYRCSNCGAVLFDSRDKFDSGTGWPSFTQSKNNSAEKRVDRSLGMEREEVICKRCGAHLGHVFDDGPAPTGQRYCINSASLNFQGAKDEDKEQKHQ